MNLSAEFDATTGFIFYVIPIPNHQNLNLIIWSFWDLVIGYWLLVLIPEPFRPCPWHGPGEQVW